MRTGRSAARLGYRHQLRRALPGGIGIGCGSLFLATLGAVAGTMWALALDASPGLGTLCGGLALLGFGVLVIPLNARVGMAIPLGFISVGLMLFVTALGAALWLIGVVSR